MLCNCFQAFKTLANPKAVDRKFELISVRVTKYFELKDEDC